MFTTNSLLDPFFTASFFEPRVYVISDSEYKKIQEKKVIEQVSVLEQRAETQQRQLQATLDAIGDLRKQLPPSGEKEKETETA